MRFGSEHADASANRSGSPAMKVRLLDLPDSVCTTESTSITRVVHDMKTCTIFLVSHPSGHQIEISFAGVIGVKILDERDFSMFWRANIEKYEELDGALVALVQSGGWREEGEISGSYVPTGFYGEVFEYFVSGDYECVNILCTQPPSFGVRYA